MAGVRDGRFWGWGWGEFGVPSHPKHPKAMGPWLESTFQVCWGNADAWQSSKAGTCKVCSFLSSFGPLWLKLNGIHGEFFHRIRATNWEWERRARQPETILFCKYTQRETGHEQGKPVSVLPSLTPVAVGESPPDKHFWGEEEEREVHK